MRMLPVLLKPPGPKTRTRKHAHTHARTIYVGKTGPSLDYSVPLRNSRQRIQYLQPSLSKQGLGPGPEWRAGKSPSCC